ncbi:MAG: hypothetical protein Fur0023_18130 [Bacteroidia bacterium]
MTNDIIISDVLLEKTNLLVVVINQYGNVEYISPAAERLIGYSASELYGDGWWRKTRSLEEAERVKRKLMQLFSYNSDSVNVYEHELICKNGNKKWIRWEINKISDDELIGIGQDITDRKQFEASLKEQILLLNDKNKNITDSILYAKRLQNFILKQAEKVTSFFTETFVLYLPKDIISGDYYSFYETKDNYVIVLADCTGHGVPGAMMSFLAHSIIREVIYSNHNTSPSDVLYKVDKGLQDLLNNSTDEYILDGMDLAVVFIDKNKSNLQFSGAFRPLYIKTKGQFELLDFSKCSIGFSDFKKEFFTIERQIEKGDVFYLFTDGITDQFGGQRNKKLTKKAFLQILNDIQDMPMEEQGAFLEYTLNNWKQQNEQTDDITVIGIKI